MREIKFRAWDKKENKWLSFDESDPIQKDYSNFNELGYWTFEFDFNEDRVILMQYIGLKDKNKKEAYWNDIVSDGINSPFIITSDYHLLARLSEIEFEIIGNIYENPKLLKE